MQSVRLKLTPTGVKPRLHCSQYDVGRELKFLLYEGVQEYVVADDETVTIHGVKEDKHIFTYGSKDSDPIITVKDSEVTILTTEQMTAIDGLVECELVIWKNTISDGTKEKVIGTINFEIEIEKSPIPQDGITSASDLATYQQMIDSAKDSKKSAAESAELAKVLAQSQGCEKVTLQASNWVGDNPPFTYDLGAEYSDRACVIAPSQDATDAQVKEWAKAEIYGNDDSKLYARKSKPTMDISADIIYLKLRSDLL